MLIALITTILIALIFGKITYKEIKEYVRKGTEKKRSEEGGKEGEENGGDGEEDSRSGGDHSKGQG